MSTTACQKEYEGFNEKYADLYTEAVYSMLSINGFWIQEGHYRDPKIMILEVDDYGRVMFAYCEDSRISTLSLLILQKSDEQFSYFYQDINFISEDAIGLDDSVFKKNILNYFSEEEKQNLKNLNDWNEQFIEEKCIKVLKTNKKVHPQISDERRKKFEYLCQMVAKSEGCSERATVFRNAIFCIADKNEKLLYYVFGVCRCSNSDFIDFDLAIIINADNTFEENICVLKLENRQRYQNELGEFKKANNWEQ